MCGAQHRLRADQIRVILYAATEDGHLKLLSSGEPSTKALTIARKHVGCGGLDRVQDVLRKSAADGMSSGSGKHRFSFGARLSLAEFLTLHPDAERFDRSGPTTIEKDLIFERVHRRIR